MASTFGGLFSAFALFFTAPMLAKVALNFGAPEYFALGIFGLSIVTGISSNRYLRALSVRLSALRSPRSASM